MTKRLSKEEIRLARAALKMTRKDLARATGINIEALKYIEQGHFMYQPYKVKDEQAERLFQFFTSKRVLFLPESSEKAYGLEVLRPAEIDPKGLSGRITGDAVRTARSVIPISQKNLAPLVGIHPEIMKYVELGRRLGLPYEPNAALTKAFLGYFKSRGVEVLLPTSIRLFGVRVRKSE